MPTKPLPDPTKPATVRPVPPIGLRRESAVSRQRWFMRGDVWWPTRLRKHPASTIYHGRPRSGPTATAAFIPPVWGRRWP